MFNPISETIIKSLAKFVPPEMQEAFLKSTRPVSHMIEAGLRPLRVVEAKHIDGETPIVGQQLYSDEGKLWSLSARRSTIYEGRYLGDNRVAYVEVKPRA